MRFILPKMGKETNEENYLRVNEYARRTELITRMFFAGWLNEFEIKEYVEGIVANVEMFDEKGAVFWTVDDLIGMPRGAMLDWAYEPTYNITAFLMKAYWRFPYMLDEMPGFREAIKGGMLASTYVGFRGHHSEGEKHVRAIYDLFQSAGADQFCDPGFNSNLCPEFTKMYFDYGEYFYRLDAAACCGNKR